MEKKLKNILVIFAIIFLSVFVRVYSLSEESLWKDEALNVMTASKETVSDLIRNQIAVHQSHPPLFALILHYSGIVFGFSEFSIRFISVIFGVGIVFMVYLISKELFNKKTAVTAMVLSALSPVNLIYSQEAKQYAMLGFFVLLSTYFLIKMIKDKPKINRFMILYFAASLIMIYTHAIGLIFFFMQAMFLMLFEWKIFSLKKTIFYGAATLVLSTPLIYFIWKTFSQTQADIVSDLSRRGAPLIIAKLGYLNLLWPVWILGILFLIFYLKFRKKFTLYAFYHKFETNIREKTGILLFLSMIILIYIICGVYVNTKFPYPFFITKYPFFMLAFVHIFIGRILAILNSKKIFYFLITLIVLINVSLIFNFYITQTKSDWRGATEIIRDNANKNDIIVYSTSDNIAPFLYYFPDEPFNYSDIPYEIYDYVSMETYDEDKIRDYPSPNNESLAFMKEIMEKTGGGVWVIQYYSPDLRPYFDEFSSKNLVLRYKKHFDNKDRFIMYYYASD